MGIKVANRGKLGYILLNWIKFDKKRDAKWGLTGKNEAGWGQTGSNWGQSGPIGANRGISGLIGANQGPIGANWG